jgi:hypothetical protein
MSVYLIAKNPVGTLGELKFQYTPQIEYSNDVKYDAYSLTHTNYQPYAYSRTENPTIGLTTAAVPAPKISFKLPNVYNTSHNFTKT